MIAVIIDVDVSRARGCERLLFKQIPGHRVSMHSGEYNPSYSPPARKRKKANSIGLDVAISAQADLAVM
jgi:hypothetical protein